MNKEEVIAKAIETLEATNKAALLAQGMSEEVANAHMVIGRDQTTAIISESYDLFVTIGAIGKSE